MIGGFVGVPLRLEVLAQREFAEPAPYTGLVEWYAAGSVVTLEPQPDGSCIVIGQTSGYALINAQSKDPATGTVYVAQVSVAILSRGHYEVPTPGLRGLVIQQQR